MDEHELIAKILNKDETAFKLFINIYKERVMNTCYKLILNYHDSEEISQDVFIEIYYSLNKFKLNSKLNTWVYRITVNKCIDFIRKKKSKKRLAKIVSFFSPEFDIYKNSLADEKLSDTDLESNELNHFILKAIDKLPENQKIALTLSKIEDLSIKGISEIMGISDSAVESLIQRAKVSLKKYLIKSKAYEKFYV